MSRKKLPLQSAKFRKDYMVTGALVLFFLIVFGEFTLAVWLPWHLRLESMWTTQIAQQEMVNFFDYVRRESRFNADKATPPRSDEIYLFCHTLDRVAPYLHRYKEKLSSEECAELAKTFRALAQHYYVIQPKKSTAISSETALNTKKFYEQLRGRGNALPASQPEKK